jgi:alpha-mannosidase
VLEYGLERPQGMSAWRVGHPLRLEPLRCTALKRLSRGPYVAALEATFAFAASEVVLTYELRAGEPRLYLKLRVTWREFGSATVGVPFLRLALPLQLRQPVLTCEVPFGAQTHDFTAGEEVPGLTWGLVRGEHGGLLLLNQGQHAYALDGQTLRLNLLRASYEPDPMPEIGQHEFALALQPVAGDYPVAAATRAGHDFNRPLQPIATGLHAGTLPPAGELLVVSPPEALVGTLKQAEDDGAATILRLGNPGPAALAVTVTPGAALGRRLATAVLVDLHEEPLPGGTLAVAAGAVTVPLPAHSLATLRLTWQPR